MRLGDNSPLVLIAGPCVIESEAHAMCMAENICGFPRRRSECPYIYKASYDKANRTSLNSYRGPGMSEGLRVLRKIKDEFHLMILSDVHDVAQIAPAAQVCDVLQIPAFLSRQTDLLLAAGRSGRVVNLEKGTISFAVGNDQRR